MLQSLVYVVQAFFKIESYFANHFFIFTQEIGSDLGHTVAPNQLLLEVGKKSINIELTEWRCPRRW